MKEITPTGELINNINLGSNNVKDGAMGTNMQTDGSRISLDINNKTDKTLCANFSIKVAYHTNN